jgi:hypothetical protein
MDGAECVVSIRCGFLGCNTHHHDEQWDDPVLPHFRHVNTTIVVG